MQRDHKLSTGFRGQAIMTSEERQAVEEIIASEIACPTCGHIAKRVAEDAMFYAHGYCGACDQMFDLPDVDYSERDDMINNGFPDDDDDDYWFD